MSEDTVSIIRFEVGKNQFAVKTLEVFEVLRLVNFKQIPNLPITVRGVFNLRGILVMALDLRLKLKLKNIKDTKKSRILITDYQNKKIGFIIDNIIGIEEIRAGDIDEPDRYPVSLDIGLFHGIIKIDNAIIPLIKTEGLVTGKELDAILNMDGQEQE